jgi:acetolactate synthase-1/2/3 large subunit
LSFPDFNKLAIAFGITYNRCENHDELGTAISEALSADGPTICEVVLGLKQGFAPRASSRRLASGEIVTAPMEDMAPFLSREELRENMVVPIIEEDETAAVRATPPMSAAATR